MVVRIERVDGFTRLPPARQLRSAITPVRWSGCWRSLRLLSERIHRAELLGDLLETSLRLLDDLFGFRHSMILLVDERNTKLFTIASRGYPENGVGSEVGIGKGLIGLVLWAGTKTLQLSSDRS